MSNPKLNQGMRFMLVLFFALAGVIPSHSAQAAGTGTISGVLYKSDGITPVTDFAVQVRAVQKSDAIQVDSILSNPADGSYTLPNVPFDTDLLVVASDENPDTDGYGTVYYKADNAASLRKTAITFHLSVTKTSYSNIDITLPPSHPAPFIEHFTFNVRTEHILADKRIRQAIAYGTDRERILNKAFLKNIDNYGTTLNSLIEPGYWSQPAYDDVSLYPYNPAQAKSILDAANIKDTNGDGVREIKGVNVRLTFKTTNSDQRIASSAIFKENMLAIGLNIIVSNMTEANFYGTSGPLQTGDFDIVQFTWGETTWGIPNVSDLNMDDAYPLTIYQNGNSLNYGGYLNANANAKLNLALNATSRASMLPYVLAYYAITTSDLPSLPLFTRGTVATVPTSSGKNVLADLNSQGISVRYQNVIVGGRTGGYLHTTAIPIHPGDLPANNTLVALYEIGSSVSMSAGTGATVCVNYGNKLTLTQENKLQLYHLTMNGTRMWTNIFISRNTDTNQICGFTKSFSAFAVLLPKYNIPVAFIKELPVNHSISQPLNASFGWKASTYTTSYEICYDNINNNLCDGNWTNIGNNIYTVIKLTKYGVTYYWEARAVNKNGYTYADNSVWNSFSTTPITVKKTSSAAQDGWILETAENSNKGGSKNSTSATFSLGDNAANKQYRAILHFDTSSLPDKAIVTSAVLKISKQGWVGTNPFTTHGPLLVDIRKPYFGTTSGLAISDFQAATTGMGIAKFGAPSGSWYSAILSKVGRLNINRTGATQFRLRFTKDDNNDHGADYVMFYSGSSPVANRPQLIIKYYMP